MDAFQVGIELHGKLEEIFSHTVNLETFAANPGVTNEPAFRRALENYHAAIDDLNAVFDGQAPKLKTVFEEILRNDGVYEYTSTGSCDGSQSYYFRRKPARSANPSSWESIDSIPEGAKYNHD